MRQLLEDLGADRRLTFRRIAARHRPSPVVRRLAAALCAVCDRLERAVYAAAGIPPPSRKRRRRAQTPPAPRCRIGDCAAEAPGPVASLGVRPLAAGPHGAPPVG